MQSIVCSTPAKNCDLSIAGIYKTDTDPFTGDWPDEPCEPTFEDIAHYVDADGRDNENERPDAGGVMRLSESNHFHFWTYFDRFVRYWPKRTFHVKHAYDQGFVEKKKRRTWQSQPLFDALAVEMTERHLDAWSWAEWKGHSNHDPVWLALHMPKFTTVDLIDVDAKQYRIGYYREAGADKGRLMPVVHLPLDHFKLLKRVYDAFQGRIWCISSETLGVHAWKKHDFPRPSLMLHQSNKKLLTEIGLPAVESHPMSGRCLRRPFGDGYRTVTPEGVLTEWTEQVDYFENDGRTPSFKRICQELVTAMYRQWQAWERWGDDNRKVDVRSILEAHRHELQEVADWLRADCPLEAASIAPVRDRMDITAAICRDVLAGTLGEQPPIKPAPTLRMMQALFLVSSGEKTDTEIAPILAEAQAELSLAGPGSTVRCSGPLVAGQQPTLASFRGGNWAKELLRLARAGLVQEDSVGTVVYEMAKWLWWIELYSLPEAERLEEVTRLLTAFVLAKHNNCVSRITNGQEQDVVAQIARCVKKAADISEPKSVKGFDETRAKWLNGGYKHPIRIVPALTGKEETSLSPSRQFTFMCINFEDQLPEGVQARIRKAQGRNRAMHFATGLINWLHSKNGKAHLGRKALTQVLGYNNANHIAKYVGILEAAGIIRRDASYKVGRNGKCYYLDAGIMEEMRQEVTLRPLADAR